MELSKEQGVAAAKRAVLEIELSALKRLAGTDPQEEVSDRDLCSVRDFLSSSSIHN